MHVGCRCDGSWSGDVAKVGRFQQKRTEAKVVVFVPGVWNSVSTNTVPGVR